VTGLLLAAAVSVSTPADTEYRAALELVYDGAFHVAERNLAELADAHPDDPLGAYLLGLALCWRLEQRPERADLDPELLRQVDRALGRADARLARDPDDARARLGRAAAHALRSRYLMLRGERRAAARDAVTMRKELRALLARGASSPDAVFGLGLYDYYADVLPRFAKFLRFFAGIPGGDRERGLRQIEEATEGTLFHGTEARVQLYEIYAFYEDKPDRALEQVSALRARYPGWPLWGLKLAEHLRDRMGLYARSAEVAREILETAEAGRHPNYQPVVAAMARVSRGESLLLDLRFAEAREAILPAREGSPEAPLLAGRAEYLLGRSLELEGDRRAAIDHYRRAALSPEPSLRRAAGKALDTPVPTAEVRALELLARARRRRERGHEREAAALCREALALWPRSREAALFVAADEVERGRLEDAKALLAPLLGEKDPSPPWLRPWSSLIDAERRERAGEREAAARQYKRVFEEALGQDALRQRASAGLRRLGARPEGRAATGGCFTYSN
jgi:hypothetical protein